MSIFSKRKKRPANHVKNGPSTDIVMRNKIWNKRMRKRIDRKITYIQERRSLKPKIATHIYVDTETSQTTKIPKNLKRTELPPFHEKSAISQYRKNSPKHHYPPEL